MTKLILAFSLILVGASAGLAQAVTITPKKTVYQRTVREEMEHKKSFTITYPKVSGLSAALNRKIEKALSYERVFDFKLADELKDTFWLDEADFATKYNADGILAVALFIEGSGAYPSGSMKHIVINTKTGLQAKPDNIFLPAKKPQLIDFLEKRLRENNKKAIAELKADNAEDAETLTEMLAGKKFEAGNLNDFTIDEKGVTFFYEYGFPHVVRALEPDNALFVSYADLKPFIRTDGLLGKFIR